MTAAALTTPAAATEALPAILLVEDEPTTRLMTARQLKRAGYEVEAVSNGVEALARLKERFFPLLLIDWEMPEMDGLALCRAVRENSLEGYIYTILLTARSQKEDLVEGMEAGADDFVAKPFDRDELRVRLRDWARFETFVAGPNAAALAAIAASDADAPRVVWLWGRAGTGKTHLLQAACAAAGERGGAAAYFDLRDSAELAQIKEKLRKPVIFDGRNIYDRKALEPLGFEYFGIGV